MLSYSDRLEDNLRKKVDVLEKIYESDKRFEETFNDGASNLEQYDEYLIDQGSYMEDLDDLDAEYDGLFEYLTKHKDEVRSVQPTQKARIDSLIKEIEGKIQAVNDAEAKVRTLTGEYFRNRKSELASSRKTARVIQNHYRSAPIPVPGTNSMFDITN